MSGFHDHGNGRYSARTGLVHDDGSRYTDSDLADLFGGSDGGTVGQGAAGSEAWQVQQAALTPSVDQVSLGARSSGGWTSHKLVSAATTNATSLKASPGQIGYIFCSNVNAAQRYLKLYNKASAPSVGSDTPVHTLIIPGNTAGAGHSLPVPAGIEFTTGIAYALTTEATDAGTTGVALSEIVVNIGYK